jgi:hypothetical protein
MSVQLEKASLSDASNTYELVDVQLGESIRLGDRNRISAALDLGFYRYSAAARTDTTFSPRLGWSYPLSATTTFLANAQYTSNNSSQTALYSYRRATVGAGVTVSY